MSLSIGEPICVAPTADVCGEGAVWHAGEQALYWTDINRFLVHRFQASDRSVKTWYFHEPVTALTLTASDDWLTVVLGSRVTLWHPATDTRQDFGFGLSNWPKARFNDGRPYPRGSLWVGSMSNNVNPDGSPGEVVGTIGALFRIDPDRTAKEWRSQIGISNTFAWNTERTKFYTGDTSANEIWQYDYDMATGEIANGRTFFKGHERGFPDGSALDANGFLWNCRYYGGCIVRVSPDGQTDRVIEIPTPNVTTCTFGGADLTTLYITTAAAGSKPSDRFAGGLFTIQTNVQGQAENRFLVTGSSKYAT